MPKANAQSLTGIIRIIPSLTYQDCYGNPNGNVVKVLEETLKKINIKSKFEIKEWVNGYELAKNNENYFIFPMAKTPEREKYFKFTIPMYKLTTYLYARKNSNLKINSLKDALNQRVCVVKNNSKHDFLRKENFLKIIEIEEPALLIKALDNRKCDLIISSAFMENYWVKRGKIDQIAKKVFEIKSIKSSRYVAFNKQVSNEIINNFNKALEQVLKNKHYNI